MAAVLLNVRQLWTAAVALSILAVGLWYFTGKPVTENSILEDSTPSFTDFEREIIQKCLHGERSRGERSPELATDLADLGERLDLEHAPTNREVMRNIHVARPDGVRKRLQILWFETESIRLYGGDRDGLLLLESLPETWAGRSPESVIEEFTASGQTEFIEVVRAYSWSDAVKAEATWHGGSLVRLQLFLPERTLICDHASAVELCACHTK